MYYCVDCNIIISFLQYFLIRDWRPSNILKLGSKIRPIPNGKKLCMLKNSQLHLHFDPKRLSQDHFSEIQNLRDFNERKHSICRIIENLNENIGFVPHLKGVQFFLFSKMSIILSHQRDPGSCPKEGCDSSGSKDTRQSQFFNFFSKYEDLIQLQWNMSWKFLTSVTIIYLYLILLSGQLIQQSKSFPCLYPQFYIRTVQQIRQVFQVSKNKWREKNYEITAIWFDL